MMRIGLYDYMICVIKVFLIYDQHDQLLFVFSVSV